MRSIGDDPHMIPGGTFWIPAALRRLPRIASALLYTQTPDQPPKRPHIRDHRVNRDNRDHRDHRGNRDHWEDRDNRDTRDNWGKKLN